MVPRRPLLLALTLMAFALGAVPVSSAQQSAPPADRAFASAVQLQQQRLYAEAQSAFSAFRAHHPHHVLAGEALYLQAQSALASGDDALAVRLFEDLQTTYAAHPQGSDARLRLAQYYLDQGDTGQAQSQLNAVIENASGPQAARALYLRAMGARENGNLNAALRDFQRIHQNYPTTDIAPAALYAQGATQVRLEQYDAAASSFETLGRSYPESPYARNLGTALAEVYYRLDEYEQAITELSGRASTLDGNEQARALFLLAESYNQLRQAAEATTHYRRVIENHPNSPYATPARFGLAWQHYTAGDYPKAAEAFAQVRDSGAPPLSDRALYYEAVSRAQAGERSRAIELYQQVPNRLPDSRLASESLFEAGLLHYQQENHAEAAAAFRQVIDEYPDAPRAGATYQWLGNAYLASGQRDQAVQAYDQAQAMGAAPDSLVREVQFQEGWSQYSNEEYAAAASTFLSLADAHPQSARGADALFWAADSRYNQGSFSQAETAFRRYLEQYETGSHRAGALYALGWIHFKQERYGSAAQRFRQFLDAYDEADTSIPYRQDARLRLADSYFALKRYDDAVSLYRSIEGEGADYAAYRAAEALNYAGQPDDALNALAQFSDRYASSPWGPEALYQQGAIHFQEQEYEAAREAYRRFLEEYPSHRLAPEAQYGIGDSYYNAGAMSEAVDAYRAVLQDFPNSATASEAASSLFFALSAAGQQDRADEIIASIVEATSDADLEDQLRFNRAKAAFQSGSSKRALSLFREFVRTSSTDTYLPRAYYFLGLLYADQDQYTEATNYLQQLVDQYPESARLPEGALRLGDIYLDQNSYEEALAAYRAAAESNQINDALRAQARYGEAVALLRLGRNEEAKTQLNALLEENSQGPIQASARLGLGRIAEDEGRMPQAQQLYRAVVNASDGETGAEALYRLGRLLRQQGQPRPAIQELDRMSSLFGGYPEWIARALLEQGRAYRQLGETGQAAQLFDEVVQSYPGTPYADSARTARESL